MSVARSGPVRFWTGERGGRLRGHLGGGPGQLLVDHRQRGWVAVDDRGQVAGVGGDVDDRAEQVGRPGLAGGEAVKQPGVGLQGPGEAAAALLREDGRGQRVNLIALQTGQ